jgi:hypothetical protein
MSGLGPLGRRGALALIAGSVAFAWLPASTPAAESLPAMSVALFSGSTLPLESLKGRVTVIRFVASW